MKPYSLLMTEIIKKRTFGFKFLITDWAVIAVSLAAVLGLDRVNSQLWWMVLIAVAHFFLFCNVFRVRRILEIIWACVFVVNVALWLSFNELAPGAVLACQIPVTICLVLIALRSPGYHGILAKRINPDLERYLNGE